MYTVSTGILKIIIVSMQIPLLKYWLFLKEPRRMIFYTSEQILEMGKLIVEILQELPILISAVQRRCAMLASF